VVPSPASTTRHPPKVRMTIARLPRRPASLGHVWGRCSIACLGARNAKPFGFRRDLLSSGSPEAPTYQRPGGFRRSTQRTGQTGRQPGALRVPPPHHEARRSPHRLLRLRGEEPGGPPPGTPRTRPDAGSGGHRSLTGRRKPTNLVIYWDTVRWHRMASRGVPCRPRLSQFRGLRPTSDAWPACGFGDVPSDRVKLPWLPRPPSVSVWPRPALPARG